MVRFFFVYLCYTKNRDMIKNKLKNYNTSKFYFNPQKEGELKRLEETGMFSFDSNQLSKSKLCSYIALMYDPNSELRKEISNYPQRKAVACDIVEFKRTDGKFSEKVEYFVTGRNKKFNMAIVNYISKTNNLEYMTKCVKEHAYVKLLSEVLMNHSDKNQKLTKDMLAEIKGYDRDLFGGDEVKKMREALYESGEEVRLMLRMEDLASMDEEEIRGTTNQYGNYRQGGLKYDGDQPK